MPSPYIEFEDVHKAFDGTVILDGVSFTVDRGTTFAILGPSGVGKTVLLTHLVGFLKPDSGRILVEGEDVTAMDERGGVSSLVPDEYADASRTPRRYGLLWRIPRGVFDSDTPFTAIRPPAASDAARNRRSSG